MPNVYAGSNGLLVHTNHVPLRNQVLNFAFYTGKFVNLPALTVHFQLSRFSSCTVLKS
jgi:hypothetical protein